MIKTLTYKILSCGVDLFIAGLLYIAIFLLVIAIRVNEVALGYAISSTQVTNQFWILIGLGAFIWIAYSLVFGLVVGNSPGRALLGVVYVKEAQKSDRFLSVLFSPLFYFDELSKFKRSVHRPFRLKLVRISFSVPISVISYLGLFLFLLILGIQLFKPNTGNTNFYRYAGSFRLVEPKLTCNQNLSKIRSRTVEIVGDSMAGTGILLSNELVVTNNHVIDGQRNIRVRETSNNHTSSVNILRQDPDYDLALLKGNFSEGEHVQFVDPSKLAEGDTNLFALGYPGSTFREIGKSNISITSGIYSSLIKQEDGDLVQTDTAINPGNSGGPLVTKCGQIVGISTLQDWISADRSRILEGMNYAISSTVIIREINKMTEVGAEKVYIINPYQNAEYTRSEIIRLINLQRSKTNASILVENTDINTAASKTANDMIMRDSYELVGLRGGWPYLALNQQGYESSYASILTGMGYYNAESAVDGWMSSVEYRNILLNARFSDLGIAIIDGKYKGNDHNRLIFVYLVGR